MAEKQKTLAKEISLQGVGLHTGQKVGMTLKPAEPNTGFVFVRTDLEGNPAVEADANFVTYTQRGTILEKKGVKIHTTEHILAALTGMDVDNAIIELDNAEPPIMDGSAKYFVDAIDQAGVIEQDEEREYYTIKEIVSFLLEKNLNFIPVFSIIFFCDIFNFFATILFEILMLGIYFPVEMIPALIILF